MLVVRTSCLQKDAGTREEEYRFHLVDKTKILGWWTMKSNETGK